MLAETYANVPSHYFHCSSKPEKRKTLLYRHFFDAEAAYALKERLVYGCEKKTGTDVRAPQTGL